MNELKKITPDEITNGTLLFIQRYHDEKKTGTIIVEIKCFDGGLADYCIIESAKHKRDTRVIAPKARS